MFLGGMEVKGAAQEVIFNSWRDDVTVF